MKTTKNISIVIILCSLFLSGCGIINSQTANPENKNKAASIKTDYSRGVTIGSKNLLVEVADTPTTRAQGLAYRNKLPDNTGMLFDFTNTKNRRPNFWMKDMKFNIDIIWINNGKIIGITKNIPAPKNDSNFPSYSPPGDITHVLEVPSGWADQNNIQINDTVKL
jgi:uncharacterized protein